MDANQRLLLTTRFKIVERWRGAAKKYKNTYSTGTVHNTLTELLHTVPIQLF